MRYRHFVNRSIVTTVFVLAMGWAYQAAAQIDAGTWVRTDEKGKGMTMTVETCCNGGRRLVYQILLAGQPPMSLTVDSPMDGTEVPALVGGKPSGQTMVIKRVDDHHYSAIVKMNGKPYTTSNATLSADGRTLTVQSIVQSEAGKTETIETWVRK